METGGEQHMHVALPEITTPSTSAHALFLVVAVILICDLSWAAAVADIATCPEPTRRNEVPAALLADGNAAFEAGDLAKAEARWKQIRECAGATAGWPKAVFNLGLLEYRRKNFRQAITYFDEILQSRPDDKEPGGNIMETNRNYSHRSALGISQCYEAMGAYDSALRYALLAKTRYRYYSWCGTCSDSARFTLNKRIAYLTARASHVHIWATMLLVGLFGYKKWKVKKRYPFP
jgi:tetratricopeptide (TPR) repeat protein